MHRIFKNSAIIAGIIAAMWVVSPILTPRLGAVISPLPSAGKKVDTEEMTRGNEEIIKRFNQIYYDNTMLHCRDTKWLGVMCMQNPCDQWVWQEMIYEINPDLIIETGTCYGGSTLFYASILELVNDTGKVISVDITSQRLDKKALNHPLFKKRVKFIEGDSVSEKVINDIKRSIKDGDRVLVTLDSDHTKGHVLKELQLYSKFVSVGSYIIVQDTNVNGHPVYPDHGPGPMEAVEEFLKTNTNFVVDHSREKFMLTFYPSGFLKRIK